MDALDEAAEAAVMQLLQLQTNVFLCILDVANLQGSVISNCFLETLHNGRQMWFQCISSQKTDPFFTSISNCGIVRLQSVQCICYWL